MSALAAETLPLFVLEIGDVDTSSPRRARRWLSWVLETAGVSSDTIDAAVLAASELVTNVGLHVGCGRVLVSAEVVAGGVRLIVRDDAGGEAWQQPGDVMDERGRGLILIAAMSVDFNISCSVGGTTVACLIP